MRDRTLYLTMKGVWFDKIYSGEKTEEYREMTPYWIKRLKYESDGSPDRESGYAGMVFKNDFVNVRFARGGHFGKSIRQMVVELLEIRVSEGKPEWGAEPGKKYFVIKLGKRFTT